jgi:hypothetical protein
MRRTFEKRKAKIDLLLYKRSDLGEDGLLEDGTATHRCEVAVSFAFI